MIPPPDHAVDNIVVYKWGRRGVFVVVCRHREDSGRLPADPSVDSNDNAIFIPITFLYPPYPWAYDDDEKF